MKIAKAGPREKGFVLDYPGAIYRVTNRGDRR
jgi:hypothetical protein